MPKAAQKVSHRACFPLADIYCMHLYPKGPCAQTEDTLAPKYLYRDYFKAKTHTICVHGP